MKINEIYNCSGLVEYINEIGFLPLLHMGLDGWSAEEAVDEECRYVTLPDGGWEWPLWEWKGDIIRESGCAYGKFFARKAAFISREWWPDFCNWRRNVYPHPEESSIEDMILQTLQENGSMITRDLRKACGFTGTKMRGKFDTYISRLEMGCYIVTEDFVYSKDRHGRNYGWGMVVAYHA
ncbi:AlkZ-related protein [Bacteroides gallinaceum]|uniref:AlkZ-related protein n=1 Tax=Bacteroides gallinaceum TaxID=1462571 RepID=UPI0031B81DED